MLSQRYMPTRAFAPEVEGRSNSSADKGRGVAREPMFIVTFACQKGGSGKTTLCGQLAVQADIVGAGPVALIDTDVYGGLSEWSKARELETPRVIASNPARLPDDIQALRKQNTRLCFIDTPQADAETMAGILACADLVVIPTRPSPHDLRALGATLKIVEPLDKRMLFIVNGASATAPITAETAIALSQHGTVAPVIVHQRTELATSMSDGQAVVETEPSSAAAGEIAALWRYLSGQLERFERRRQQLPFVGRERRAMPSADLAGAASGRRDLGRRGAA